MNSHQNSYTTLDAITTALDATLVKRAPEDYSTCYQTVALPEGHLCLHYHAERNGDFISVSADWPRDAKGSMVMARDVEYNTASPGIKVSAAKSPVQIARDIRRRFMPEFSRLYAMAMAVVASRNQYEATVAANYALLARACGGSCAKSSWRDAWDLKGLPEGVAVTSVGDTDIRLELTCSIGMACDILRHRSAGKAAKPRDELRRQRAIEYAARVRAHPAPCVYGHLECADRANGPCLDELFSGLGLDNDGDWIEEQAA